ncbi:MAG: dTDP-glucose 4,6-dehydratase [Verrucomicrobiales bacterium]|jgi:dTDP-glucose 4,6-dehydratase|nr:dTDP-glucose 4,6-dehydratase [Verrucomicrobiales bacterium]|tara:strand:- start:11086 stop:12159 length:1074 start_codon:yes stop_codon:yes gene_type:complete
MAYRILVTGGAGFIGSNLIYYLLDSAEADLGISIERVVTLDKLTYAGNPENLEGLAGDGRHRMVQGDICDANLVSALLKEEQINSVIHLAAESHVDRSIDASSEFIQTNVVGTHTMLNTAMQWANMGEADFRFLHVSTDEVYGALGADDPAFSEVSAYAPNSPYSASKAGSDHLARAWFHTYGFPVIITNCSNNYGPRQFPEKLVPLMIQKLCLGKKLPIYGDGSNVRDWLYVEDHCRALVLALVKGAPGEAYNVGGKCELSNLAVAKTLITVVAEMVDSVDAQNPEEWIEFVTDRPGHDWRYAIDFSKINRELQWEPKESFVSGLKKTVQWYLANQSWISRIEDGSYRGERLGLGD